MTADPIAGIIYPVRSVAPDITATMKATIDAIGALFGTSAPSRCAGTEIALVGTNPPSGTVARTQSTTITATTSSVGVLVLTLPTVAPHGVIAASVSNATVGTNLSITISPAASNLTGLVVTVYFAADSSLYASASAKLSLVVTYW